MVKRKFKQRENNSEKSSESPNRSNKRSKLSPGTFALNQLEFNDDSPDKNFLSNHSCSVASDILFIDTKVSKKVERKPRYTTRRYFWESERCYYYLRKCMLL